MPQKRQRIYVYKWKDSDQVAGKVKASSTRQAEYKLGLLLKRGFSWLDDALETGLIHFAGFETSPVPSTKPRIDPEKVDSGSQCPNCGGAKISSGRAGNAYLCTKCGWSWDSDVDEAIDYLVKNWGKKPGRAMLKAWKKSLGGLIPLSRDISETY